MPAPFELNLRHLRSLSAVVEQGTLSAAAARVGLSQPALTQGLSKLERQLGELLFERRPGGLSPTAAGTAMAARATTAFVHLAAGCGRSSGRGFTRPEQLITATQLDAYLRVADAGGFSGAAQASGLSQPALHRAVRDLEQVTGQALIERRGRGSSLTPAGRRMARGVRLAEREIAAGIAELAPDPRGAGRIVIGAMPMSRAHLLPRALAAFTREAPGVAIEVVEGSWRELADPLLDGVLDLMLGALRPEPPAGLEQQPLFRDRVSVIGRAGHPLATVSEPTLDQLAAFPWISGSAQTPLAGQFAALFGDRTPPAPIACGSVMVIRGMLRETNLLTLLSPEQVALEIEAGWLATIGPPLANSVRTIGLTTRTAWRPPLAQARLIELLQTVAGDMALQENE
ncbi:LysR family transcriptional regulator [Sphingomonas ginkgonis]|uniref:LysR family transcriptional regulator n=1 Tax=Sphingomonas ginkgonis TaxID=2315330 RepID=A0A3R9X7M9_9SPHN|nr:LysR family transcriptional regulator [Sphingomonas ginkgonis]RST30675.1 LysR family transcriptional regulator [Sphingomonas ginkgonis]